MVCFKAINQKKEICCICQDACKPAIKCRFCVQGIICSDCAISSCEHGVNKKCPCCRREKENGQDWKEHLIKPTKICPIGRPKEKTIEIVVTDSENEKEDVAITMSTQNVRLEYHILKLLVIQKKMKTWRKEFKNGTVIVVIILLVYV